MIVSPRYGDDFKSLPMIAEELDAKTQDAQSTINSWQDAITQITVNDGVPALAVSTANGNNQQAVNDLGGVDYWAARAYQTDNEVRLNDGTVVVSIIDNNNNNPNSNMTGWKKKNSADQIFDESGLSQQVINNTRTVNIESVADFNASPLLLGAIYQTKSYISGNNFGSWSYKYDGTIPKSKHNGGTIIVF